MYTVVGWCSRTALAGQASSKEDTIIAVSTSNLRISRESGSRLSVASGKPLFHSRTLLALASAALALAAVAWLGATPAHAGTNWAEDWTQHNVNNWYTHTFRASTDTYTFGMSPDTLQMHGDSWGLETRQSFNKDSPISVVSTVKAQPAGPNASVTQYFAGLTIYTGESGYKEIALRNDRTSDGLQIVSIVNDALTVLPDSPAFPGGHNRNLPGDQFYKLRLDYDGQGTLKYYVNDLLVWTTSSAPFTSDPNIFILSVTNNSCSYQPFSSPCHSSFPGDLGTYSVDSTFQQITVQGNYNLFANTTWVSFNAQTSQYVDTAGSDCGMFQQCDYLQLQTIHAVPPSVDYFLPAGYTLSPQITVAPGMSWGELAAATALDGQQIRFQVLDGGGIAVPDQYLPGNAAGFTGNMVNLSGLNPALFPTIILKANFSTANLLKTPKLFDWAVTFLPPGSRSCFTWYDQQSPGMKVWLLAAHPDAFGGAADFFAELGSPPQRTALTSPAHGQASYTSWPGTMGGPLKVTKLSGLPGIVSQRVLYGDSLEETVGVDDNKLSSHYYWTWYDGLSNGFRNWVLIANPSGADTVAADLSFVDRFTGDTVAAHYVLGPGQRVIPEFPGKMGGPVELKAYVNGGSWTNSAERRNVIASQRVTTGDGIAFNEVAGIAEGSLSTDYFWTWYDNASPDATNWVLISNPNPGAVTYQIKIGGLEVDHGTLQPGEEKTPTFPGTMAGPVEVISTGGKVIASQRSIWKSSFEEVPGYPLEGLGSSYLWTWYDSASPGALNWIVIANTGNTNVTADVYIGGIRRGSYQLTPAGMEGSIATPKFDGLMGGLVEVRAHVPGGDWSNPSDRRNVLSSQRVLWKGFFNEVPGTVLNLN